MGVGSLKQAGDWDGRDMDARDEGTKKGNSTHFRWGDIIMIEWDGMEWDGMKWNGMRRKEGRAFARVRLFPDGPDTDGNKKKEREKKETDWDPISKHWRLRNNERQYEPGRPDPHRCDAMQPRLGRTINDQRPHYHPSS